MTHANDAPTTTSTPNPYVDGKCWYGVKVPGRPKTNVPCGLDARPYRVKRADKTERLTSFDGDLLVWACNKHKATMEGDGFILTLVSETAKMTSLC